MSSNRGKATGMVRGSLVVVCRKRSWAARPWDGTGQSKTPLAPGRRLAWLLTGVKAQGNRPWQNLLVFILEHFDEDMNKEYNKIYKFLNIKQINVECEKVRIGNYNKNIDDKIYKDLVKFYKKDVNKLERLLNIKTNWF